MEAKRVALPSILSTRDATVAKDDILINCYTEKGPDAERIVKRPGTVLRGNLGGGCIGQGAYYFVNGPVFVACDELHTEFPPALTGVSATGGVGTVMPPVIFSCPIGWEYGDLYPDERIVYGLAWNGSVFCSVGAYFTATSPTGEFWNYGRTEFFPYVIHSQIVWNGFRFCTIGWWNSGPGLLDMTQSFTSSTGAPGTWNEHPIEGPAYPIQHSYALGTFGGAICAVPYQDGNVSLASLTGITWTAGTLPAVEKWRSVAGGNGVFVTAARFRSRAAVSINGVHWTEITMPFAALWSAVAFNGEYFCYVSHSLVGGAAAPSVISYDGYEWIAGTNPMPGTFYDNVCWDPTTQRWFSTVGNNLSTSTNGLDWTVCPMESWITSTTPGLLSNGVNLCAVGPNSHSVDNVGAVFAPLL